VPEPSASDGAGAGASGRDRVVGGRRLQNKQIAAQLGSDPTAVGKWRRRFAEHRLDGLYGEPRPGAPRRRGGRGAAGAGRCGGCRPPVVWTAVLVGNVDNVIRPLFVLRGSALPLLLVLISILGGAMAFGLVGVFLGPTTLAILYALMREWSPGEYLRPSLAGEPRPPVQ
jgi:hypothetical protein